jgi:rRNA maturation RNase YbeY
MNSGFEIRKVIRSTLPSIPFKRTAREILGPRYELSLVICGDALARRINRTYRLPALKLRQTGNRVYVANVLSFPYSKNEGEVFLNIHAARREAKRYGVSLHARLTLLFIHACFHLKGLRHGRQMESLERTMMKKFGT